MFTVLKRQGLKVGHIGMCGLNECQQRALVAISLDGGTGATAEVEVL